MSAVFLPFITNSSSEEAIFKALIKQKYGISEDAVIRIFSHIVIIGIDVMRTKINSCNKNETMEMKLNKIVNAYPEYAIPKTTSKFWKYVMYLTDKDNNYFPTCSSEDKITLFTVLAIYAPDKLKKYIDTTDIHKYSEESFDEYVKYLECIKVKEHDSKRIGFTCWEEFKAYVAISSLKEDKEPDPICPVFIRTDATLTREYLYKHEHCSSPY